MILVLPSLESLGMPECRTVHACLRQIGFMNNRNTRRRESITDEQRSCFKGARCRGL